MNDDGYYTAELSEKDYFEQEAAIIYKNKYYSGQNALYEFFADYYNITVPQGTSVEKALLDYWDSNCYRY